MANPIVVFARPDDLHGQAWANLEIAAFDDKGQRLTENIQTAALIVLKDTISASDMPTQFDASHPVLWVEHGGKPANPDQLEVIGRWPNATRTMVFSHVPGREIYDNLKILLNRGSDQERIASAIRSLADSISLDVQWSIVNQAAMLHQVELLCPDADLEPFKATIAETKLGAKILKRSTIERLGLEGAIADEVQRLLRLQAA